MRANIAIVQQTHKRRTTSFSSSINNNNNNNKEAALSRMQLPTGIVDDCDRENFSFACTHAFISLFYVQRIVYI